MRLSLASAFAAVSALALSAPALADTLIDNVDGVTIDAEGKVTLLISPPREDGENPDVGGVGHARKVLQGGGPMGDIEDLIPFRAEWRA